VRRLMTEYQTLLNALIDEQQLSILLGGQVIAVRIHAINGDHVILHATEGDGRYDLHFSQVIFFSVQV